MCQCNPEIKSPFCGGPGCEWPEGDIVLIGNVDAVIADMAEQSRTMKLEAENARLRELLTRAQHHLEASDYSHHRQFAAIIEGALKAEARRLGEPT